MNPQDPSYQKLKIAAAAKQHAVDWGTGIVSREQREHSFRMGDAHGYQRAIDELKELHNKYIGDGKIQFNWGANLAAEYLESKQKQLLNSMGALL